jgi:hypothetical protein
MSVPRPLDWRSAPWLAPCLVGALACGDDDQTPTGLDDTDTADSGFTSANYDTDAPDTNGSVDQDPLGEGDLRGILTFTFYPPDAATGTGHVGLAGAWRDEARDFDEVDDFFAVYALQTTFPPPPSEPDDLSHDAVPTPFDWGRPDDWRRAGNGMKLVTDEVEAVACLLMVSGEYPVYVASHSSLHPEGCEPDLATWQPDTTYDVVLYGGELFETNVLVDRVRTPAAFEVSAPALDVFNLRVPRDEPLEVRWSDNGNSGNRLVIRMMDVFGRMFTVNAVDDGSYAIPTAAMTELAAGPVTITIAREQVDLVPFTDGVVKVVTRYEHWGYLDLD